MKSRIQLRTLIATSVIALVMMMLMQFSAFAEGGNIEPPDAPYPTDTLEYVSSDSTDTSTMPTEITDQSLLDVVITVINVIL